MFDSLPARGPVLKEKHWGMSLAMGILGFFAGGFGLKAVFVGPDTRMLLAGSVVLGVAVFCTMLMLCYVYEDAERVGLHAWRWFGLVALLNLVGFLVYLFRSAAKNGEWRRATVPAAYGFEVILMGALVLMPLIYTEALPKLLPWISLPLAPPALGPARAASPAARMLHHTIDLMKYPVRIPKTILYTNEQPAPPSEEGAWGVVGIVPGGGAGAPNGVLNGMGLAGLPPPPAPASKGSKVTRIKVGGLVEAAMLIFQPKLDYPPLARMAHIQGVVRLEAVISRDGTIENLKVIGGPPLLVKAATDSVSRWRYQPTLLNGDPVEVVTEIDVNFILAQ
jgi:protein TonB